MSIDSPPIPLTFATARDDDAARVTAVLYALGYDAVRVDTSHARPAREVALERLAKRYRLNESEALVAEAIVNRKPALDAPRTIWVRRSMLVKVGCADDFALVVLVLSLCDAQAALAETETVQESQETVVGAVPSKTWV